MVSYIRRRSYKKNLLSPREIGPKPSLRDVTYGDLGLALSYRILTDIREGLEKLDKVMEGVNNPETLLYAPEAKLHAIKPITDSYLQTNIPGVYVAGDGAGLSRGIVGAAACGVLAAEGILRDLD